MQKQRTLWCALVALALMATAGPALAQAGPDPGEIADACIERVTEIAANRATANGATASQCIERIDELLDAGEMEKAERVAARCIHRVKAKSRGSIGRIRARSARCRAVLVMLGAPDLAETVKTAARAAIDVVKASKTTAVDAIRGALP
jgi:hypothetical protein